MTLWVSGNPFARIVGNEVPDLISSQPYLPNVQIGWKNIIGPNTGGREVPLLPMSEPGTAGTVNGSGAPVWAVESTLKQVNGDVMGAEEEAKERAERLEQEARDAIAGRRREDGIRLAREALAIRQAFQGEGHPDLIWPLSLCIEVLRRGPDRALEAARLGERRLALRRTALAGAPDELACSLRELIDLYTCEYRVLDPRRVDELRRELAALPEAGGAAEQEV